MLKNIMTSRGPISAKGDENPSQEDEALRRAREADKRGGRR
ncbi:hypothetical protein AB0E08_47155 [Streptomyces sp. NPDC048281]